MHLDLKNLLKPKLSQNSLSKAQLDRQLIEILPNDLNKLIIEASSEGTNLDDFTIEFQHFDFKPLYQRDFVGKPHSNFLGVVKFFGPVFISIMDLSSEDIKALKEDKTKTLCMAALLKIFMTLLAFFSSIFIKSHLIYIYIFFFHSTNDFLARGRSASIGAGTLLVKKLKDPASKDKRADKSPTDSR